MPGRAAWISRSKRCGLARRSSGRAPGQPSSDLVFLVEAPPAIDLIDGLQEDLLAVGAFSDARPGFSDHANGGGEHVIRRGFNIGRRGHGLILNSGF